MKSIETHEKAMKSKRSHEKHSKSDGNAMKSNEKQ
jgi:hypothetical protein